MFNMVSKSFLFLLLGNVLVAVVAWECSKESDSDTGEFWNDLRAKWGPNLTDPNYFRPIPKTTQEAEGKGYVKVSGCDPNLPWMGQRFVKDNDYALTPLYDINGTIAGIQSSIPNNLKYGFPSGKFRSLFVDDGGNRLTMTVYFVDPDNICKVGRSISSLTTEGTGTGLFIQTAWNCQTKTITYKEVPMSETELAPPEWILGLCVPSQGLHYGFESTAKTDCKENYFPGFLQYHQGHLVGFGFHFLTNQTTSDWFETPPATSIARTAKEYPSCVLDVGHFSNIHVFFTDRYSTYNCQ